MNTLQTYITSLVREQGELTRNLMQTSFKEQLFHQKALTGVVIKKLEEMVKLLSSSDKTTDGAHANLLASLALLVNQSLQVLNKKE